MIGVRAVSRLERHHLAHLLEREVPAFRAGPRVHLDPFCVRSVPDASVGTALVLELDARCRCLGDSGLLPVLDLRLAVVVVEAESWMDSVTSDLHRLRERPTVSAFLALTERNRLAGALSIRSTAHDRRLSVAAADARSRFDALQDELSRTLAEVGPPLALRHLLARGAVAVAPPPPGRALVSRWVDQVVLDLPPHLRRRSLRALAGRTALLAGEDPRDAAREVSSWAERAEAALASGHRSLEVGEWFFAVYGANPPAGARVGTASAALVELVLSSFTLVEAPGQRLVHLPRLAVQVLSEAGSHTVQRVVAPRSESAVELATALWDGDPSSPFSSLSSLLEAIEALS